MPLAVAKLTTASALEKVKELRLAVMKLANGTDLWWSSREHTLNCIPLHAVLRGDLSEAVLDNGSQGVVVEMVMINLSTVVDLALSLESVVETRSSVAATVCWSGSALSGGWVARASSCSGIAATTAWNALRVPGTDRVRILS